MKLSLFFLIIIICPFIFFGTIKSSNQKEINNHTIEYEPTLNKTTDNYSKVVALTFDDGPSNYTDEILDVLEKYNVTATFFVVGTNLNTKYNNTMARLIKLGNEVGIHGYSHKEFTKIKQSKVVEEIEYTNKLLKGFNIEAKYIRPPYGSINNKLKKIIEYPIILWNVDTLDWKYKDALKIYNNSIDDIHDGSIILMHDHYLSSVKALDLIIPKLQEDGYKIVNITELFSLNDINLENGKTYRSAK